MLQVVFSVEAVSYNLKTHDHLGKLSQVPVYIYIIPIKPWDGLLRWVVNGWVWTDGLVYVFMNYHTDP